MSPENERMLCVNFPELYGSEFAFCCGDGWVALLHGLSEALIAHASGEGLRLAVTDVKEKHGTLRFYAEGTDEVAEKLIEDAERASASIPEVGP